MTASQKQPYNESHPWVVYSEGNGWLEDTCAGGTFNVELNRALRFESPGEAMLVLLAADINPEGLEIQRA